MNTEYKKHIPAVLMGVLVIGMGAILWYGILPLQAVLKGKMDDIQKFHANREYRERQIQTLPELRDQFESIAKDEAKLNILVSKDRIVDFVKTLEGVAADTEVAIAIESKGDSMSMAPAKKKPAAKPANEGDAAEATAAQEKKDMSILGNLPFNPYLSLSIRLTGEYRDVLSFLHKLEKLPVALDVVSVSLQQGESREQRADLPVGSGVNPFSSSGTEASASVSAPQARLEAVLETVVYLEKTNE